MVEPPEGQETAKGGVRRSIGSSLAGTTSSHSPLSHQAHRLKSRRIQKARQVQRSFGLSSPGPRNQMPTQSALPQPIRRQSIKPPQAIPSHPKPRIGGRVLAGSRRCADTTLQQAHQMFGFRNEVDVSRRGSCFSNSLDPLQTSCGSSGDLRWTIETSLAIPSPGGCAASWSILL